MPQTRQASRIIHQLLLDRGIFTKFFGTGFAGEPDALPASAIPSHHDFVLIVHDTGAQTSDDCIFLANLSAPLLLLRYTGAGGNLESKPSRWGMVSVALGMDPMATISLRMAGFDTASSLLLPADQSAVCRTQVIEKANAGFTILAAGDLTAQSSILTLVDGFIAFRENFAQPCRLILWGRALDARAAKAVQDRAIAQDLGDALCITGGIDNDQRDSLITASDLFVLQEAGDMPPDIAIHAAGLGAAVLAPAVPAVVYALGDSGLEDGGVLSAEALAQAFLGLATDPGRLSALAAAQQRHLAQTRSAAQAAQLLLNALGRCGLALPAPAAERVLVQRQLGFIVAGHFEGSYSIAAVNRLLATALEQRRPGSVQLLPVAHHQRLDVLQGIPPGQEALLQRLFARYRTNGAPVVAISQHFPPWPPDIPNALALSLFTWEETLIPAAIVESLNTGFAGVLAVSRFVAKTLIDSGVRRPVAVVGQAVEAALFQAVAAQRLAPQPQPPGPFTALHISSCFLRKGVDVLLAAWAQAFAADDPVELLIKTFPNPHHRMADDLEMARAANPGLAKVTLIDADLDQAALLALYRQADCMVLPSRGEGFNMVAAEAMLAQLPLIVTGFGGHLDFAETGDVRLLAFRLDPSRSHVAGDGALWAEPDIDDLVAALREAFAAYQDKRRLPAALPEPAAAAFSAIAWSARIADFATGLLLDAPRPLRRMAWVSSWGVRCGIAEYSGALLESRPEAAAAPEVLLLCDTRTRAAITPREPAGTTVVPVWTLGSRSVARDIAPHLHAFDPQILLIQHQAGLISWEDLLQMIDSARATPARLMVVLHSTEAIASLHHKLQASVLFNLSLVARVIVHTLRDVETLQGHGLLENVTLLPHGAGSRISGSFDAAENRQGPLLGCYGFFLPHKGIATLIEAFAGLLQEFPAARLRLVNAAFPSDVSAAEIRKCRALARQLCIDHAITFHVHYLDAAESKALLTGCDLIVMPYDHTPESVSGAVRQALASGSPVAVSHSPIFAELNDAVHRVNAANADALQRDLAELLRNPEKCRATLGPAAAWLGRHRWSDIAKRLFNMAEGLWQTQSETAPRRLVLTPGSPLLESNIGRRHGKRFVFDGDSAGFGLYGPYVNLAAGEYEVVFRFDRAGKPQGMATFEAVSQIAAVTLASLERTFADTGEDCAVLQFFLAQPVAEVEFRILCTLGFRATLQSLSIALLAPA